MREKRYVAQLVSWKKGRKVNVEMMGNLRIVFHTCFYLDRSMIWRVYWFVRSLGDKSGEIGSKKCLCDLDVSYSSELVLMILRELRVSRKAEMFFWWLQESNLFEHDEETL